MKGKEEGRLETSGRAAVPLRLRGSSQGPGGLRNEDWELEIGRVRSVISREME